jgi:tetratricopeptide (TPR) repeat protein
MAPPTLEGTSFGTTDFMSPEQDLDASTVTPLADQWSLGATLAWLITGNKMKYFKDTDITDDKLRHVVSRATSKHAHDRFSDLREFRNALKSTVSGPAVSAQQASPERPARQAAGDTAAPADPIRASGIDGQCWKCGCINSDSRKFCKACGEATREACLNVRCLLPIGVWERFCPECGEDQPRQREVRLRRVQESGDLIRRHLQQQRYDIALAELQQLDSQCTTPRLRLLLAPVEGLGTEADQLQQAVQQILQRAIEQATACDYAEALQTLQQVPDVFWPEEAVTWRQSVTELQALRDALQPLVSGGRLDELKKTLQRLQQLQPGHWSAAEYITRCVEVLVEHARQLHASGQLDAALEQLESIAVTDRTDSCRQYSAALQEELDELERRGTELAAVGDYDKALELFRNLSEQRRPRSWSAWRAAAAALLRLECPFSLETARKAQAALARSLKMPEEWSNSVGMKFRPIPAGTYKKMTLTKPFWLGVHQVTQEQWRQVMGTTPWKGRSYTIDGADVAASYVSWDDAVAFCEKLSRKEGKRYRLPTDAEWEWACRAGTTTAYSFGDDEKQLGEYAWFDGNAFNKGETYAHPVGQKKANPFGLYDVHGNVWEWCSDWYGDGNPLEEEAIDPQGPPSGSFRVSRGGSWDYVPVGLRSSYRVFNTPDRRGNDTGCRVVLECG